MANIHLRPSWNLPERFSTPETLYQNRREFMKTLGVGSVALAAAGCGSAFMAEEDAAAPAIDKALPAYETNPNFAEAGRPLSDLKDVTTFNNFYEFGLKKDQPARYAKGFKLDPYLLKIDGLVNNPMDMDLDQIEALGLEERVYRFRCVEAWGMALPWLGVPLAKIIAKADPKPEARFVAFRSFEDAGLAPGFDRYPDYPWPYHEGLRIDEAQNELTLAVTGLFGRRLPPQSGTPLRIVTPWKYGYKGPKSVVQMTFTEKQPATYWNTAVHAEYKFYSNVDPEVPHPRWSQASEWWLGNRIERHPSRFYNGYGEQVAHLYDGIPRTLY